MNKLFTIILLHYNQEKKIYEAIDSVLMQDYDNIELIINDDKSKKFDKNSIEKYINKKRSNIKLSFIVNDVNLGTVQSVNNALKLASGEFFLIFAADDSLTSSSVVSKFVKEFNKDPNTNILTAQCFMYDIEMKEKLYKYVNKDKALSLNDQTAFNQFKELTNACLYVAGATAYRKEILAKHGYPKTIYKLTEDLTYWLHLTRNGEKLKYVNFVALNHRDGGVSSSSSVKKVSESAKKYYYDIIKMYEIEVFPYMRKFTVREKEKVFSNYLDVVNFISNYHKGYKKEKKKYVFKLYMRYFSYFIFKVLKVIKRNILRIVRKIISFIKRINKKSVFALLIWILLNYLSLNVLDININNYIIIYGNYFLSFIITYLLVTVHRCWGVRNAR